MGWVAGRIIIIISSSMAEEVPPSHSTDPLCQYSCIVYANHTEFQYCVLIQRLVS
jgi:hypothetical protein